MDTTEIVKQTLNTHGKSQPDVRLTGYTKCEPETTVLGFLGWPFKILHFY